MAYVDGYVLPVPKGKIKEYRKVATWAGKVWMKYGALRYRECVGEDLDIEHMLTFPKQIRIKKGETVIFSYIEFKSRAHRDQVNAKVSKEMQEQAPGKTPEEVHKDSPFDMKRMAYGGFKVLVDL